MFSYICYIPNDEFIVFICGFHQRVSIPYDGRKSLKEIIIQIIKYIT